MFFIFSFLGLVIRILLIGVPGFKADVAYWKGWGLAVADKGIIWLANNTNYNYPPGFAYVLYAVNKIYALFFNPYNINEYWLDNNYFYLLLIKLITIVADIGITYLIYKIARKLNSRWGKILALFYFLNIVAIFDGVIWGQVDQFGLFLFLLSVYFLIVDRPQWASVFFIISFLMKFQSIIFIPIFFLYIYKKYSFSGLMKSLKVSFFTFTLIITPFWLNREMASLIRLFTINSDWFPWYSLNAFNLWWLASGLNGMQISDKTLILGIINAKQLGLIMFSFVYFVACLNVLLAKKNELIGQYILSLVLAVFAFFHLLTQSHERYLFLLLGLYPLLYFVKKEMKLSRLLIFLLMLTVGMFFNMYISAAMNYPDQVYWPVSAQLTKTFTAVISVYQIGLFIYFVFQYFGEWMIRYWKYVSIGVLLIVGALFFKNKDYILHKPISLTQIAPIYQRQDYLEPVNNMTVESARGVFFWNRLSDNYYFYKKGIGSHANSEIYYDLGGRFSRFRSEFGIDNEGAVGAKAVFVVQGDGHELFRSKEQDRFDYPKSIDISVRGVKQMTLIIAKTTVSNSGIHADWLDPELIR